MLLLSVTGNELPAAAVARERSVGSKSGQSDCSSSASGWSERQESEERSVMLLSHSIDLSETENVQ